MTTEQSTNINTVTPRELSEAIKVSIRSRVPLMIWGAPGIGKSQIMRQVADEEGFELRDVRATLIDPIDLRGIPHAVKHGSSYRTHYAPPAFLPNGDDKPIMLFVDELPNATQSVQSSLYQLFLDRALGEYTMPDSTIMCAAGNREGDKGATHKMPLPLANRFCHLELVVDNDQWADWAFDNAIDHRIIALLSFRPQLLHNFDPRAKSKSFPTPRSWEKVSDTLAADVPDALIQPMIAGLIGDGAATEFASFCAVYKELPTRDSVVNDPQSAIVPKESSALWAVATLVTTIADSSNAEAIMQYVARLPDEYAVLAARGMSKRAPELLENKTFIEWANAHRYLFLGDKS